MAAAAVPTLLTALHRLGAGLDPVEPREDLSYAANYLYMLTAAVPDRAARTGDRAILDLNH